MVEAAFTKTIYKTFKLAKVLKLLEKLIDFEFKFYVDI